MGNPDDRQPCSRTMNSVAGFRGRRGKLIRRVCGRVILGNGSSPSGPQHSNMSTAVTQQEQLQHSDNAITLPHQHGPSSPYSTPNTLRITARRMSWFPHSDTKSDAVGARMREWAQVGSIVRERRVILDKSRAGTHTSFRCVISSGT